MKREGPRIQVLLRRLSETPQEFLNEPVIGGRGHVVVSALVNDFMTYLGEPVSLESLAPYISSDRGKGRNRLALVMIAIWLLYDESFLDTEISQNEVEPVLRQVTRDLSVVTGAHSFVNDPDRREELVRMFLSRMGLRPSGESEKQAADRLTAISSLERDRLLAASRTAEKRAREVREALARKAAQESADKWSRE